MKAELRSLLRHPAIRRTADADAPRENLPTGFSSLNARLPDGGWSIGGLTEILYEEQGIGELHLVMPALAHLSRRGLWLVWVSPPYVPYAPALSEYGIDLSRVMLIDAPTSAQCFWAAEQALRTRGAGAVLLWPEKINASPFSSPFSSLRRLQLAAEAGHSWGLLFRPERQVHQSSPAALRLRLSASSGGPVVRVLKCRGGVPSDPFVLGKRL